MMNRTLKLTKELIEIGKKNIRRYFIKYPALEWIEFHPEDRVVLRFKGDKVEKNKTD